MAYVKIKGKTYGIHTGSRGGRYWIDESGKKHYLKSNGSNSNSKSAITTPSATKQQPVQPSPIKVEPKLKRWIGWFYQLDEDGERIDDFKEWCDAYSEEEAKDYFESEHWRSIQNGTLELDYVYLSRD